MKTLFLFAPLFLTSCVGSTGSGLVDFSAFASGPPGVTHAFEFCTTGGAECQDGEGYQVTLTEAQMHIGAVYLTASVDNPGSANTSCINPGRYVAEVPGSIDFDVLSPSPQPFQVAGSGTADRSLTGEVWLVGITDNVNTKLDATHIVETRGTATRGGKSYPFHAFLTISDNRAIPVSDPSQPGLNPICKQRIVSPIPILNRLELFEGGALFVTVDPRGWFTNVDFAALDETLAPPYEIPDDDSDANGRNFFHGVESSSGVYSFDFRTP